MDLHTILVVVNRVVRPYSLAKACLYPADLDMFVLAYQLSATPPPLIVVPCTLIIPSAWTVGGSFHFRHELSGMLTPPRGVNYRGILSLPTWTIGGPFIHRHALSGMLSPPSAWTVSDPFTLPNTQKGMLSSLGIDCWGCFHPSAWTVGDAFIPRHWLLGMLSSLGIDCWGCFHPSAWIVGDAFIPQHKLLKILLFR